MVLGVLLAAGTFSLCKGEKGVVSPEWDLKADSSTRAFIANYWNPGEKYFNYGNGGSKTDFHYWPQAHALDLLADAWLRSGDTTFLTLMHRWFEGVPLKNGGSFLNRYNDDMEWNALAMLRAYQATGDEKFVRYLTNLIGHHALPPALKKQYTDFLVFNARTLWNEGTLKKELLYSPYWKTRPGKTSDLTVALNGSMLMEAVAELVNKGYLNMAKVSGFPEWSGNPVFKGWYTDPGDNE